MAGTVSTNEKTFGSVKCITFDWTSAASGAADGTTTAAFDGRLVRVVQIPSETAPTNLYDVEVQDKDGTDLLHGLGANLSNSVNTCKSDVDGLGAAAATHLTLAVTNAGNAKIGKTIVYIR